MLLTPACWFARLLLISAVGLGATRAAPPAVELAPPPPPPPALAVSPPASPPASPLPPPSQDVAAIAPPSVLGRSGRFGLGIGAELLGIGLDQAFSGSRDATGLHLSTAAQLDLGPRWALRLPLSADTTVRHDDAAYLALAFSPGAVYRWRQANNQRWVPFVGGGVRLGATGVRRDFVGLPLLTAAALFIGHHHFGDSDGGHADDPNVETHGTIAPEAWGGFEYHPNRWFAWVLSATYTVTRISGATVHLLREGVAFRLTM